MNAAHRIVRGALVLAVVVALSPAARADESRRDSVPMPAPTRFSYRYDAFEQGVARPAARSLLVRKLSRNRREAENVDSRDRVLLPSTWWQPRVGYKPVTGTELLSGPGSGTGPAAGPWKVVKAKTEGVSRGFQMEDSTGARFAIKFDPPLDPDPP